MGKLKNIAKWCGSILFFVFAIAMLFSKGGFLSGLLFLVAAVLINPLSMSILIQKGIVLKKPIYITSIVLSTILAFILTPTTGKSKEISTEPTQIVSQTDTTQESLSDLDKLSRGIALSETTDTSESIDISKDNESIDQTEEPTWVINTKVKKVHTSACNYVSYIEPTYYATSSLSVEELQADGYSFCKFCLPNEYANSDEAKEQERLEKLAQEQLEQARLEQERKAQEQAEKEKAEKEKAEKEKAEKEKAEKAKVEKEKAEKEKQQVSQSTSNNTDNNGNNFYTYNNEAQQQTTATYVLNNNPKSMKIHIPTCSSVKQISPEHYATTNLSIAELEAQGYSRCGRCLK